MSRFDEEPDGDTHGECVLEIASLQSENARLREEVEMLNVRHAAVMLHAQTHADEYNALREDVNGLLQDIQRLTEEAFKRDEELSLANGTIESRDRNIATLQEELAEAKRDVELAELVIQQKQEQIASAEAALEQSEASALEYKTEHAALLGTSQWQEVEIADLRDDVKRLMQTVSECEERALANEKDAAVAKFGATCFAEHRSEMSDLDGGWLQERALECGLIYGKEVTAEMWDGCGSVHCECEIGDTCYFPTEAGKAAIAGAKHE